MLKALWFSLFLITLGAFLESENGWTLFFAIVSALFIALGIWTPADKIWGKFIKDYNQLIPIGGSIFLLGLFVGLLATGLNLNVLATIGIVFFFAGMVLTLRGVVLYVPVWWRGEK